MKKFSERLLFALTFPFPSVCSVSRSFFFVIGPCKRNTAKRHWISWNLKYPLKRYLVWQIISLWLSTTCWHLSPAKNRKKSEWARRVLSNALRMFAVALLSSLKNYVNAFPISLCATKTKWIEWIADLEKQLGCVTDWVKNREAEKQSWWHFAALVISLFIYEHNIVNVHLNVNLMQVQKRKYLCWFCSA